MDQPFDIAIRRARLRGRGDRLAEIGIRQGRIVAIGENLERGERRRSTLAAIW